jgi:uncharacterized protein YcsI (UPF0317 family)
MDKNELSKEKLLSMSPAEFRNIVRVGEWTTDVVSNRVCRGYVNANLAIVPQDVAFEFLLFCSRNPGPCPVIDVTEPGNPHPSEAIAKGADLRTDLPKYRVFKSGELIDEPTDIIKYWREDLVAFLLGCSLSFEWVLEAANIHFRLMGDFITKIPCVPAGRFHGPMVVSCRVFEKSYLAMRAIQVSSRFPSMHGAPIHIGAPNTIGIRDLGKPEIWAPDPAEPLPKPNEIIMFWAAGPTPQLVALQAKIPFMITHKAGHMFITDQLAQEQAVV